MRALTVGELDWVSGGILYSSENGSTGLDCGDTVFGCDEAGGSYLQQMSFEAGGASTGGSETVVVHGQRPFKIKLVSSGIVSRSQCEHLSNGLATGAVAATAIGLYSLYGAEAAAAIAAEGETLGVSTVYVAEAIAQILALRRAQVAGAVIGGVSESAIKQGIFDFACN